MSEFQVTGSNANALFTLKIHRGDGMALVAMNWKDEQPPLDFVGFAIEYKEPDGNRFFALKNRIAFPGAGGNPCRPDPARLPYLLPSAIQYARPQPQRSGHRLAVGWLLRRCPPQYHHRTYL